MIQKVTVKFTFRCVCSLRADYIHLKGYNLLMMGEQISVQISVQRTSCFPGTWCSGEMILDTEGKIGMSLDRVNVMSRVDESDGSDRVGLIEVMYRVGLIGDKLIEMLNQKEYFTTLREMKVGPLSRKLYKKNSKSAFIGDPLVENFLAKIFIEGAAPRIYNWICNRTYMESCKRLLKGSGCHWLIDPVKQGGIPLEERLDIKSVIRVNRIKMVIKIQHKKFL